MTSNRDKKIGNYIGQEMSLLKVSNLEVILYSPEFNFILIDIYLNPKKEILKEMGKD